LQRLLEIKRGRISGDVGIKGDQEFLDRCVIRKALKKRGNGEVFCVAPFKRIQGSTQYMVSPTKRATVLDGANILADGDDADEMRISMRVSADRAFRRVRPLMAGFAVTEIVREMFNALSETQNDLLWL